jgi:hypothetical protein
MPEDEENNDHIYPAIKKSWPKALGEYPTRVTDHKLLAVSCG